MLTVTDTSPGALPPARGSGRADTVVCRSNWATPRKWHGAALRERSAGKKQRDLRQGDLSLAPEQSGDRSRLCAERKIYVAGVTDEIADRTWPLPTGLSVPW